MAASDISTFNVLDVGIDYLAQELQKGQSA